MRSTNNWIVALAGVAVVGLGLVGGAAFASGVPALLSPSGLSAANDVASVPKPEPTYDVNKSGESYGSLAQATSPETEPDLIQAVTNSGLTGYVKKSDLDEANGTTAAKDFRSPDDALRWQESAIARGDILIPVYAKDGVTVIGDFTVAAPDPQYVTVKEGLTP